MEYGYGLVVQLSSEQFSKHGSTFLNLLVDWLTFDQVPEKDGNLDNQVVSLSLEHLVGKAYTYTQAIDLLKNVDANQRERECVLYYNIKLWSHFYRSGLLGKRDGSDQSAHLRNLIRLFFFRISSEMAVHT